MVNQPFTKDYSNPDDQAIRRGQLPDSGTTGPNAPANTDPASYRNQFVSQLRKNPPSKDFYQQVFSSQSADDQQQKIDELRDQPNFSHPGDQALAKDFLAKYTEGGKRGLMPLDEQINQDTIAAYQSQQPGQGIGDGNVTAASRIKYPGATGTQTS